MSDEPDLSAAERSRRNPIKTELLRGDEGDLPIASAPPEVPTLADVNEPTEPKGSMTPDEALRAAIRAALDAGDDARAEELMAILRRRPAPVLRIAKDER